LALPARRWSDRPLPGVHRERVEPELVILGRSIWHCVISLKTSEKVDSTQ
jgi:hypothetical protein